MEVVGVEMQRPGWRWLRWRCSARGGGGGGGGDADAARGEEVVEVVEVEMQRPGWRWWRWMGGGWEVVGSRMGGGLECGV